MANYSTYISHAEFLREGEAGVDDKIVVTKNSYSGNDVWYLATKMKGDI